jgi:hypothetical protein
MTASATIGALRIELGMDAATFDAGVKKAEAAMDRLGASMAKAGDFLRSHAAAIGTAFGVMGVAMGMGIKSAVDRADELDELAQKLGITVEALSGLEYATKLSGVPLETLGQGVTKLSLALQGIAQGDVLSAAARGLSAMGISAREAGGQLVATDELLLQISDKFAGMRDGAEKTALAMNLFGKSGAQLIPFLNAGRDGIEEMRREADEFGLTLTADAAAGAGLLNEQLDKSVAIFQGFSQHLAQKMTPALIEMTGSFISLQKEMKLTQTIADGVAFFFKGIVSAGMMISTTFNAIANDIWTLLRAAGNLATFDFSGASAAMKEGFAATRAEIEATHGAITRMFHEAYGPPPAPTGGSTGGEPPAVTSSRAITEAKAPGEPGARRRQAHHRGDTDAARGADRQGA